MLAQMGSLTVLLQDIQAVIGLKRREFWGTTAKNDLPCIFTKQTLYIDGTGWKWLFADPLHAKGII